MGNTKDELETFEKNKELDEWLMVSGESNITAGSSGGAIANKKIIVAPSECVK